MRDARGFAAWVGTLALCACGDGGGLAMGASMSREVPWTLTVHEGYAREAGPDDWPNPHDCSLTFDGSTLRARCDGSPERAVPAPIAARVIDSVIATHWDEVGPQREEDMSEGGPVDETVLVARGETHHGSVPTVSAAVYRMRSLTWGPGAACERDADCRRFPCTAGECRSRCADTTDSRSGEYDFISRTGCRPLAVARDRDDGRFECLDPITCEPMRD